MSLAGRIVVAQALLGVVCCAVFTAVSWFSGTSALLAVAASGLPCAYHAWVQARTLNATRLLMHGVLKTVLTAVLIAVSIIRFGIEPVAFFVTFAVLQLSYLSGLGKQRQKQST